MSLYLTRRKSVTRTSRASPMILSSLISTRFPKKPSVPCCIDLAKTQHDHIAKLEAQLMNVKLALVDYDDDHAVYINKKPAALVSAPTCDPSLPSKFSQSQTVKGQPASLPATPPLPSLLIASLSLVWMSFLAPVVVALFLPQSDKKTTTSSSD